jgi:hypothetical protein
MAKIETERERSVRLALRAVDAEEALKRAQGLLGAQLCDALARLARAHEALFYLVGDTQARHLSCSCEPPITEHERANLERAKAILADSPFVDELKQ